MSQAIIVHPPTPIGLITKAILAVVFTTNHITIRPRAILPRGIRLSIGGAINY
jgi:hypothetical protein